MHEALYKIVFKGEIGFDFDEDEVKESLQKFCGCDRVAVDRLFSGKAMVLKKNLDATKANSLCSSLQKLGALAMVVPMEPVANACASRSGESFVSPPIAQAAPFACPACGHIQEKGESCFVCGVIFAKFARVQERRAQELLSPALCETSLTTEITVGAKLMSFFGQGAVQPFLAQFGMLIVALTGLQTVLGPGLWSSGFIILPVIYLLFIMIRGMLLEQEAMASLAEHFNVFWERVETDESRRQWIPWVTYGIILLDILLYYGFVLRVDPSTLWNHLAFVPAEPNFWNVPLSAITSMFLHANDWQLWGSVMFLWMVGPQVEKRLGCRRFFGFYLLSGLFAGAAGALLNPLIPQGALHGLGSSGAIAGVIGLFVARNTDLSMEFAPPLLDLLQYVNSFRLIIRLDCLAFTGLFLYAGLGFGIDQQVTVVTVLIGHLIHAAGMLAGMAVSRVLGSENMQNDTLAECGIT